MPQDLSSQVAIVTGAAGGIGKATALELARNGAHVVCVDLNETGAQDTVNSISSFGGNALAVAANLLEDDAAARINEKAREAFGTVSILINNAGKGSAMIPAYELDLAEWRRDIELNLTSHLKMIQAVVPGMRSQGYGRIVNTASAAGMEGHALAGGYAAAKAGLIALTKTLGKELAKDGVIVNAIAPALFNSGLLKEDWFDEDVKQGLLSRIPMGRMGEPEEASKMIAFLASPELTFSTGAVFDLSGGRATY